MKVCQICGKGSRMGGKIKKIKSGYDPVDWKRKYPNLQKTRTSDGKRVLACTDCIKKMGRVGK